MAVDVRRRRSLSSQRSIVDLLSTLLLIPILLLTSAPYARSQDVRLVNGSTSREGRLEVYYSGIWGTVCENEFDYIDASVVCNSLGLGYEGEVIGSRYGPGIGHILLDRVRCVGDEVSITHCSHAGWSVHNCDHTEDVSVACGTSPVQYGSLSNDDNFFIVADSRLRNIYQVDARSGATAQLLRFGVASQPLAVAFDPHFSLIYWTDGHNHTINRFSLKRKNNLVLYRSPLARFSGLALDVGRQLLYYADEADTVGFVGELSTDGLRHRIIVGRAFSQPRSVVVDVDNRVLYWTDWSETSPGIYRTSVTNRTTETIITGNVRHHRPVALAVDFAAGAMYWGDFSYSDRSRIETARLDGTGRRTLVELNNSDYYSFALHHGIIYITDWKYKYIRKMKITTRITSKISSATPFQQLSGIAFVPGTSTLVEPTTTTEVRTTTITVQTTTTTTTTTTTAATTPVETTTVQRWTTAGTTPTTAHSTPPPRTNAVLYRIGQAATTTAIMSTQPDEPSVGMSVQLIVEIAIAVVLLAAITVGVVVVVIYVRRRHHNHASPDRSGSSEKAVVTTNAIYGCEELAQSVGDIVDENYYADLDESKMFRKSSRDDTALHEAFLPLRRPIPPPPSPRPLKAPTNRKGSSCRGLEGQKGKQPDDEYIELLDDEIGPLRAPASKGDRTLTRSATMPSRKGP